MEKMSQNLIYFPFWWTVEPHQIGMSHGDPLILQVNKIILLLQMIAK